MSMPKLRLFFTVLLVVALGAACGDDDATVPADAGGSGADAAVPPWETVPSEPLGGDPGAACPGAFASGAPTAGQNTGFDAAGQTRSFWWIPATTGDGPRPLLVGFNGTGETGQSFSERADLADFAARGFHVVAPDSAGNGTVWPVWDAMRSPGSEGDPNLDLAYFDALVACLGAHFEIDANRLYAAGHSAGGIMTNYVVRRRSEVLAGGIVASGVFSLTGPSEPMTLDDMFVLVTWGGPDDSYSGGSGVTVPEINFVEQASLASAHYEMQENVAQANCVEDVGHAWLDSLNGWMADVLLMHPEGVPGRADIALPPVPDGSGATCTDDAFEYTPPIVVECPDAPASTCDIFCQFAADCVVENGTVGPALGPQVMMLGFSGADNADCTGCITECESAATTASDTEVLACFETQAGAAMCGAGIEGAVPFIDAVNACCMGRDDSPFCLSICTAILTSSVAADFFPECQAITGM
jgi:poly(3-hydroxybutyrate) depolymerase